MVMPTQQDAKEIGPLPDREEEREYDSGSLPAEIPSESLGIPESVIQVEEKEQVTEGSEQQMSTSASVQGVSAPTEPPTVVLPQISIQKDALAVQIEQILEEDIGELYQSLTPSLKQQFKQKGEETVAAIRGLFEKTRIQFEKIFQLIKSWLHMIPGVNPYYLIQEAKIKTDKIRALKK